MCCKHKRSTEGNTFYARYSNDSQNGIYITIGVIVFKRRKGFASFFTDIIVSIQIQIWTQC